MTRVLGLVVCAAAVVAVAAEDGRADAIPQQYIVSVAPNANARGVARGLAKRLGGNVTHVYRSAFHGFAIHLPKGKGAAHILGDEQVLFVEPDLEMSISGARATGRPPGKGKPGDGGGEDPPPPADDVVPTGVSRIGAGATVDLTDVVVAVLDTGIDLNHPDLNVNTALSITFSGGKNADDKNGHGTHVAGRLAGGGQGARQQRFRVDLGHRLRHEQCRRHRRRQHEPRWYGKKYGLPHRDCQQRR